MAEPLTPSEQQTLRQVEEQLLREDPGLEQAFTVLEKRPPPGRARPLGPTRPLGSARSRYPASVLCVAGVLFFAAGWLLAVDTSVCLGLALMTYGYVRSDTGRSHGRLVWAAVRKWWISLG
jgi:Protein of unknown function (DUF3040)